MTTTEQRTSTTTVSCVSSNVGSIQDYLFSTAQHSRKSSSSNIPSDDLQRLSNLPQIVIHTTSEQCLDVNQTSPTMITNQTSVSKKTKILRNKTQKKTTNYVSCFFCLKRHLRMIMNH